MKEKKSYQPTDSELEVLQVLWEKGSATVRQIHEVLATTRNIGYTTTLKTMQIMTDKGVLKRDTSSRQHIYRALVSREETQQQLLGKLKNGLFSGSASRLVIGALDNEELSGEEIQEIHQYLAQFKAKSQ